MAIKTLRKITAKTLGFSNTALMEVTMNEIKSPDGPKLPIFRVYGLAQDIETGTGTFGNWTKLIGKFEAETVIPNPGNEAGTKSRARQVMLPGVGGEVIIDALQAAKKQDPNASIQFGADVSISYLAHPAGDKYTYEVDFLGDYDEPDDDLAQLGQSFGSLPKLPKPKKK